MGICQNVICHFMELHFLFHLRQIIEKREVYPSHLIKFTLIARHSKGNIELEVRRCSQGHTFKDAWSQDLSPNV